MKLIENFYYGIFNWLITNKKFSYLEEPDEVHRLLSAVLLTSALMWSYSFNSYFYISESKVALVGFICTLIHLFSPLVYKATGSILFTTNIFIGAGMIFQFTHAFFSGGFYSNTTIWFSILPLIAGIVKGRGVLIGWSIIAFLGVGSLFLLQDHTLDLLVGFGRTWAQLNIALGYVLVNLVLMLLYIYFKEINKQKLADKNESIKKLLRIVSHDIANPLTIVMGRIKLLRKNMVDSNEKVEKYLEGIEKSSNMIKDILDHSRKLEAIDSGKVDVQIVEISLNEIIENSIFVFKDKIEEKEITIEYDFDKYKSIIIYAEQVSIKNQVFNNLFSNSIKFMERGGTISISVNEKGKYIEVQFADSGQGMEPDILENIFRADVKTSVRGVDGEEGTGFGMPILHATLEEIGATVEVESVPKSKGFIDHGTRFIMKFLGR